MGEAVNEKSMEGVDGDQGYECGVCGVLDDDGDEDNGDDIEGISRETRKTVRMLDPKLPSREEVEEHNLTHLPYRNWCRHCVRGRGKEMPHKKAEDDLHNQAEVHFDFCFPGEESGEGNLTIVVARERKTRMTLASAVPTKSTGDFIAKRVVASSRR